MGVTRSGGVAGGPGQAAHSGGTAGAPARATAPREIRVDIGELVLDGFRPRFPVSDQFDVASRAVPVDRESRSRLAQPRPQLPRRLQRLHRRFTVLQVAQDE